MRKTFLAAASFLVLLVLFILVKEEKGARPKIFQKGDSFIEGLKVVYRKNGQKNWIMTAKRADLSASGDLARLKDVEMFVEGKDISIAANGGTYRMNDKNLSIEGKVLAKGKNFSLATENGEFSQKTGKYETDKAVRLDANHFTVEGTGMSIDSAEQKVKIHRNVKAIFTP